MQSNLIEVKKILIGSPIRLLTMLGVGVSSHLHSGISLFILCHIFGLILGGNADFWALLFFSENQILGGGADCLIS